MISNLKYILIFIWLGISFFLGTVLSILRWGNPNNMSDTMRLFAWAALPIAGIKVEIEGLEYYQTYQPCIYVSNHQSGMDVATFGYLFPRRTVAIGKKELIYIPFFGQFFAAAGNILIDRENKQSAAGSLAKAAQQIKTRNVSLGIYPEGTRNRTGKGMLPFKKGAFYLAVEAGVPLVPVVSSPVSLVFDPITKKLKGGKVILRALPPIYPTGKLRQQVDATSAEARKKMLACYYDLARKLGANPEDV